MSDSERKPLPDVRTGTGGGCARAAFRQRVRETLSRAQKGEIDQAEAERQLKAAVDRYCWHDDAERTW